MTCLNPSKNSDRPIIIVDDEKIALSVLRSMLKREGYSEFVECMDGAQVIPAVAAYPHAALVLLDIDLPHISGRDLLEDLTTGYPGIPVIMVTGYHDSETAVACMKKGAFDFITKPVDRARLLSSVKHALQLRELQSENAQLGRHLLEHDIPNARAFERIVTVSERMHKIFRYLGSIAPTSQPVLITGETGVGKELVAHAVHTASGCPGKFVPVNAAGLDETAFSDTLFGHEKGAFTGAQQARGGLVERAQNGTLMLDEIGDLDRAMQVKLLRLLQNREYYPLGADHARVMTARVVCATNRSLEELRDCPEFRADLFYRLCTHHVALPPLRERREDLPLLLCHFLERAARELGKTVPTAPPELLTLLESYHFPGNVRELEAMTYDAVGRHRGRKLAMDSFKEMMARHAAPPAAGPDTGTAEAPRTASLVFGDPLPSPKQAVALLVAEALRRTKGNQSMAAHLLGITRQALNSRLRRAAKT